MSVPHSVTALLTSAPTIAPRAGVLDAAGPTPDGSVAAGSFISIYGQNLSADTVIGPASPLKQTLDNVTVTANGYLFPLRSRLSPCRSTRRYPGNLLPDLHSDSPKSGPAERDRAIHSEPQCAPASIPNRTHRISRWRWPCIRIIRSSLRVARRAGTRSFPSTPTDWDRSVSLCQTATAAASPLWTMADPISVIVGGSLTLAPYWSGAAPEMVATSIVQLQIVNSSSVRHHRESRDNGETGNPAPWCSFRSSRSGAGC